MGRVHGVASTAINALSGGSGGGCSWCLLRHSNEKGAGKKGVPDGTFEETGLWFRWVGTVDCVPDLVNTDTIQYSPSTTKHSLEESGVPSSASDIEVVAHPNDCSAGKEGKRSVSCGAEGKGNEWWFNSGFRRYVESRRGNSNMLDGSSCFRTADGIQVQPDFQKPKWGADVGLADVEGSFLERSSLTAEEELAIYGY